MYLHTLDFFLLVLLRYRYTYISYFFFLSWRSGTHFCGQLLLGSSQDTVMRKRFLYALGICMFVLCIGRSIVLPVKRSKTAQNKPLPAHVRGF